MPSGTYHGAKVATKRGDPLPLVCNCVHDDCVSWFSRSWLSKSEDKVPIVLLLKYYTYNRGATAQTLSAGGPGLIAPGGTPGKIKWPELGVTELRFRDRLDPADSD